jgi:LPS-assembly protein
VKQLAVRLLALCPACIFLACASQPAFAQQSVAEACPEPYLAPVLRQPPNREGEPIVLLAREFNAGRETVGEASGKVEVTRADQFLATEFLRFHPVQQAIDIPGDLHYQDAQVDIVAANATLDLLQRTGEFMDIEYGLTGSTANGSAQSILVQGTTHSFLHQIQFTTCPGDDPEWMLQARELELRHEEGIGIARGAKLRLGKVPVFYSPWLSFPIDDRRKSGFLYPRVGNTNDNGVDIAVPFYWNIRPDMDATLVPRYYSDRGLMLGTEYRFLTGHTDGILDFTYLPDDHKTDESRYHVLARLNARISPSWHADARIERVSDDEYFQDFGGSLAQTSRQYLRSSATLDGAGRYWILTTMLDDFQVIDEDVRPGRLPYRRLPRLHFLLEAPLGRSGLLADLDSEVVYFDRDFGVTGARLDLYPALAWNMNRYWGFMRTSLGYRYTSYDLDRRGEVGDESPDRGTTIASLDTGMFFERILENGNSITLEPRVYYLYVPFKDQDDLPDFDTGEFTFGFAQLFHYNRFTGADRQTDANQLTLALSTRSISAVNGREVWNLNFGQIIYFDPPQVTLERDMPTDQDVSPMLAEFNWSPLHRLFLRVGLEWDWEASRMNVGSLGVGHTTSGGHRLGFEYRFRRDRLDQFDVRYFWPINETWKLFTRVNYSLQDSELLEALAGVEYESCCWAVRFSARRHLKDNQGGTRDAFYFELRLKGMGSVGRRPPPLFYDPAP